MPEVIEKKSQTHQLKFLPYPIQTIPIAHKIISQIKIIESILLLIHTLTPKNKCQSFSAYK